MSSAILFCIRALVDNRPSDFMSIIMSIWWSLMRNLTKKINFYQVTVSLFKNHAKNLMFQNKKWSIWIQKKWKFEKKIKNEDLKIVKHGSSSKGRGDGYYKNHDRDDLPNVFIKKDHIWGDTCFKKKWYGVDRIICFENRILLQKSGKMLKKKQLSSQQNLSCKVHKEGTTWHDHAY